MILTNTGVDVAAARLQWTAFLGADALTGI